MIIDKKWYAHARIPSVIALTLCTLLMAGLQLQDSMAQSEPEEPSPPVQLLQPGDEPDFHPVDGPTDELDAETIRESSVIRRFLELTVDPSSAGHCSVRCNESTNVRQNWYGAQARCNKFDSLSDTRLRDIFDSTSKICSVVLQSDAGDDSSERDIQLEAERALAER